jgi:hypothetical protein
LHRGRGFHVTFDWTGAQASAGIAGFELSIQPPNAQSPVFDQVVGDPFDWRQCSAFVRDQDLLGWQWRVRTVDRTGQRSSWSSTSTFNFAPCRLSTGACS